MVFTPFAMDLSDCPPPVRPICQILSKSRSLKSLRDAFWEFWSKFDNFWVNLEGFLASEMENGIFGNYATQTGIALCNFYWKTLIDLKTFGALWDTFRMGPFGTPFGQGKSLRDGRWIFAVFALFRSKAFSAVRLSPERRFWKASELFRCRLFHTCPGDLIKILVIFCSFRPESIWSMFLKQKKVAFRGIFHAKVGNGSFWLILNHEKAFEMEIVFCSRRRRNLAQTNAFPYILLNVIFLTQSRIPLFQFHWKT
jgi:hypothetical protein